MEDAELIRRIGELADEERSLEESHAADSQALTDEERARLEGLAVTLDRLWDLLRQRRALRRAGRDPGEAAERGGETVEHYEQ